MIDLMKFCAPKWERRSSLHYPWSTPHYTYATNGKVGIRVALRSDVFPRPDAPDLERVMTNAKEATDLRPIPPFTAPSFELCGHCEGEGNVRCGECGRPHDCEWCDAKGHTGDNTAVRLSDTVEVQGHYLNLIASLPNVRLDMAGAMPSRFEFDGGIGVIMPLNLRDWDRENYTCIDLREKVARPTSETAASSYPIRCRRACIACRARSGRPAAGGSQHGTAGAAGPR